jgi:hypothetical protein
MSVADKLAHELRNIELLAYDLRFGDQFIAHGLHTRENRAFRGRRRRSTLRST